MNLSRLICKILIRFLIVSLLLNPQPEFLDQILLLSYISDPHLIEPFTPHFQSEIKVLR